MTDRRPLGSTYRLQLPGIGFAGAEALVDYLEQLGIDTLYVSPVLTAQPGSTHGYDVVDPTALDPDLGTPEAFESLLARLDRAGMRLLVDVVPNHMAASEQNRWWWDVLRRGRRSRRARYFDIDWDAQDGKVLLATLGRPLADVLADGAVEVDRRSDPAVLTIDGQAFPLDPTTGHDDEPVGRVLDVQHYRPAFWRTANWEGNYRRFFDIDGLVGAAGRGP